MISTALAAAFDSFNHWIVATLQMIFGYRFGAPSRGRSSSATSSSPPPGNALGGVGRVTLNRLTQGKQGERKRASA